MQGWQRPMTMRFPRRPVLTALAMLAVLGASCGGPADEVAIEREEPVQLLEDPAQDPEDVDDEGTDVDADPAEDLDTEPVDDDVATATDDASQGATGRTDLPDDVVTREGGLICHLPVDADGAPMQPQAYEDLVFPINGELEQLVLSMDADLRELEEGISDGPSLEVALEEHAHTWSELTSPVIDLAPPAGAEDWHDRAMGTWVDVCVAIVDAQAGVLDGDDGRFEAFVEALRDFPGLHNGLHANAALGPFEEG